jgi:glutamine synthetase
LQLFPIKNAKTKTRPVPTSEKMVKAKRVQDGALERLDAFFQANPSVDFVRLQWVDYSGVVCTRVVTKPFALAIAGGKESLNCGSCILSALSVTGALVIDEVNPAVDQVCPDWTSLKLCHYHPRHAQVMCWVYHGNSPKTQGFHLCPRTRLHEITCSAMEQHGIGFLVGLEIEFYILEGDQPLKIVKNAYSTASLRNRCLPVIEEIVDALTKADIAVRQFHGELGAGHFEISLDPLPPVEAADALVYGHEAIRTICANHGLHGTVFPKPVDGFEPSGQHYHLSISQPDKQESFLAGLLAHWGPLTAFCMPNFDSYSRVYHKQSIWWGHENRAAVIRKIREGHWELRTPDGTANPHLTLAAILVAGVEGMEKGRPLTMRDPKIISITPFTVDQKIEFGITEDMPSSLELALEALRADRALSDTLGTEMVEKYLKVKTKEEEAFREMTPQERKSISIGIF